MIDNFLKLVQAEAQHAHNLHGRIRSTHEGLGLMMEEFDEVRDEIYKKVLEKKKLLTELKQLVALCARMAEDCELIGDDDVGTELLESKRCYFATGQTQDSSRKASD